MVSSVASPRISTSGSSFPRPASSDPLVGAIGARSPRRSAPVSDWTLPDEGVEAGNESRFFRCHVGYPTTSAVAPILRSELRARGDVLSSGVCTGAPVPAFLIVAEARREHPEVPRIGCVVPAETAADKISALAWRVLDPIARQDPALVRHVHDVAVLEPHVVRARGLSGTAPGIADGRRCPRYSGSASSRLDPSPSASLLRSMSFPIETMRSSTSGSSAPCATATRTDTPKYWDAIAAIGVSECACLDRGLEQVAVRVADEHRGVEAVQCPQELWPHFFS